MHLRFLILLMIALPCMSCTRSQTAAAPSPGSASRTRLHGDVNLEMYSAVNPTTHIIHAPVDSVWVWLPAVYDVLDIEPTTVDSRTHRIGNTEFVPRNIDGARLSRFVQCGYGMTSSNNADTYRVTMSVMTWVRQGEGNQSVLQTELSASARPRDVSGNAVECASTTRLERRIVELVAELMGSDIRPLH